MGRKERRGGGKGKVKNFSSRKRIEREIKKGEMVGGVEEERKKNTMLLTVIAVATLLVAVVGATFAYFSLSMTGQESSTSATLQTAKVGTATLAQKEANISLGLTAEDMAKPISDTTYYSVSGTISGTNPLVSTKSGSESLTTIASAKVEGAESGTTYNCNVTLDIEATGEMIKTLVNKKSDESIPTAGWAKLKLTGEIFDNSSVEVDLADFTASGDDGKYTYTGISAKDFVLTSDEAEKEVKASLSFVNKQEVDQSSVAGQSLTVTIKLTGGECTVASGD